MLETLYFPKFSLARQVKEKKKLLLSLGGRTCNTDFFTQIVSMFDALYAVDRGLDIFCETGITPHFLIGDLDSAKQSSVEFAAQHKIETIKLKREKDDTDFQATLKAAAQKEQAGEDETISVAALNSLGGRLDHLLSNIFTFSNIHSPLVPFFMGDEKEIVFFLQGVQSFTFDFKETPRNISLFAMTNEVTGVNLTGTKWSLSNASLKQSLPYAISNELKDTKVTVSCGAGLLAFYILFSEEGIG